MISASLQVPRDAFEARTGWKLEPRGACKGELCVPLSEPPSDTVDLASVADQLGMPLVHEEAHGVWALGPASTGSRALITAEAPNLTLPDLDGTPFELSSLRGQKVLLIAWAPY